jgi:hypothetical protein
VSHETIYRSLFIQARGVLKKELLGHLRSKRRTDAGFRLWKPSGKSLASIEHSQPEAVPNSGRPQGAPERVS